MKIKFRGTHNAEEIVESLTAILQLFEEQYGVHDFSEIKMDMVLVNEQGEEVELIDSNTSEVFDILEVHKNAEEVDEQFLHDIMLEEVDAGTMH